MVKENYVYLKEMNELFERCTLENYTFFRKLIRCGSFDKLVPSAQCMRRMKQWEALKPWRLSIMY